MFKKLFLLQQINSNTMIQIYHNSRCGKSRNCLAFLEKSNEKFEIINYLVNNPTYNELAEIINKLNIKPLDLIRQKEKIWLENYKGKILSDSEIIQSMLDNPILIERPILIDKNRAIIAREPELFEAFLK